MEAGQDPAAFWSLTLREIGLVMAGAVKRIEREKLFADRAAWDTARLNSFAYHTPNKMPDFEKYRGKGRAGPTGAAPSVRQNWAAMRANIIAFNAAKGGGFIR